MSKQRIILKVGSNILVDETIPTYFRIDIIEQVLQTIVRLRAEGYDVALVISGAVAAGRADGLDHSRQAAASRGQWILNAALADLINEEELSLSLVLLSREDVVNRQRYATLQDTFNELFEKGLVPLINENDTTTIKDKNDFPDNDHLAAIMSITMKADQLFLLTNVDGVYDGDPTDPQSHLLPELHNVNRAFIEAISGGVSSKGRGGMTGKMTAARLATAAGIPTHVLHGEHALDIPDMLHGKRFGTICRPRMHKAVQLNERDRWLISSHSSDGSIVLDAGASKAVLARKSLLAVGVKAVYGTFSERDAVELLDPDKETIAIGIMNHSSAEIQQAITQTEKPFNMEVVHADNIIVI